MKKKYKHTTEQHTMDAPREIVPVIMDLIKPKSVVDVGCGIGTYTRVFKEKGANVLAIDGAWCDKKLLFENIEKDEFIERELEETIELERKFDLVFSLEVAEHLSPERGEGFVRDLANLGDVIIFSAAIPKQGGQNHLNEQWPTYWEEKFNKIGYQMHDVLRPIFWDNDNIFWWYRQNIFLVTKENAELPFLKDLERNSIRNIIHPGLLNDLFDPYEKNALKRAVKFLFRVLLAKMKS